ncbi:RNA polymerase sigma factor sigK Sigma-K factor [Brevibacillus borstelensis AK1]|uniref:RNA polymerase sigma factor sigK Sigma-K factor n=1 Tax=Brevibacillus borstelensis AK1 TaxID=1300222 RepID=M8DM80_9BACL|nr:sigma factor-like helix-turn-helix DNA-binding protein [Brevibacillus borstelensis]EMT54738.1 RNA polymerase sigma factor sigK Sigma-K factor [Brevibacillus borstelensis AK1]
MGACAVDLTKGHREYNVKYALNDRTGVDALLGDWHRLASRRFERGDYAACDVLIDLATAIKAAKLTARQTEALRLYYVDDLTMEDVGQRMGIGKQRVSRLVITGLNRVAAVYARWNYGEVSRAEQWRRATEEEAKKKITPDMAF